MYLCENTHRTRQPFLGVLNLNLEPMCGVDVEISSFVRQTRSIAMETRTDLKVNNSYFSFFPG